MPMRQDGRTAGIILFDTENRLIRFLFRCVIVVALAGCLGSLAALIVHRRELNSVQTAQRRTAVFFLCSDDWGVNGRATSKGRTRCHIDKSLGRSNAFYGL